MESVISCKKKLCQSIKYNMEVFIAYPTRLLVIPEALGRDWRPWAVLPMPDQSGRVVLSYYRPVIPARILLKPREYKIDPLIKHSSISLFLLERK